MEASTRPVVLLPEPIAAQGLSLLKEHCTCIAPWMTTQDGAERLTIEDARDDAEAIIVRLARLTSAELLQMKRLRVIVKHGIGTDNIDCEAATDRGIQVVNTPDTVTTAVAELTIALILALSRRLADAFVAGRSTSTHDRASLTGVELSGKTLGIVGFGRIGRRVAQIASVGLGMDVSVFDPMILDLGETCQYDVHASLEEMLPRLDVLSLHAPLTPATRGLIDRSTLALLRPHAFVINTARGGIIDEPALVEALREDRIGGAALDVFAAEPLPPDHPLRLTPKTILTPHVGSATEEALVKTSVAAAKAVLAVLSGARADGLLNPEVLA